MYSFSYLVIAIIASAHAKPFLYNTGQAISLAISSNSSPEQQSSNIADLRKAKVQQLDKQTLPEDSSPSFFDEEDHNEASPGIFQKKIAKIITKLQLLSSLSNGFGNGGDNGDKDMNIDEEVASENTTLEAVTTTYDGEEGRNSSTTPQFERLKQFEEATETVSSLPGSPGFPRFSLGRFFGHFIHLAYRMMTLNRDNNQEIIFEGV